MNLFRRVGGAAGRRADGAALPPRDDDLEDVHPLFRVGPSRAAAPKPAPAPAPAPVPVAAPEPEPTPEPEAPTPVEAEAGPAPEAAEPPAPEVADLMELLPPELRQSAAADANGHVFSQTPQSDAGDDILALLPPELREGPEPDAPADEPVSAEEPVAAETPVAAGEALPAEAPDPSPVAPPPAAPADEGDLDDALLDDLDPWDAPVAAAPRPSLASLLSDGFRTLDEGGSSRPAPEAAAPEPAPEPVPESPPAAPAAPPSLSAMLADGFRALDRAPAAKAPPAPETARPAQAAPAGNPADAPWALPANPSLAAAAGISGLLGACLVDSETGLLLAREGGRGLDLDEVGAMTTQVLRAQMEVIDSLGLEDRVEDILMTTSRHLHVIRPLERMATVFIFLVLDRRAANLGMVRVQLARIEAGLAV